MLLKKNNLECALSFRMYAFCQSEKSKGKVRKFLGSPFSSAVGVDGGFPYLKWVEEAVEMT